MPSVELKKNKEFTVTGNCSPDIHYMADTSEKVSQVLALAESGKYFCINRARQYGKTTMLGLLRDRLLASGEYTPILISFERASRSMFKTESDFCQKFLNRCARHLERKGLAYSKDWKDESVTDFDLLSDFITDVCSDEKYVLMIDEVDKASDNTIFVDFLGTLREKYLLRNIGDDDTFHSVILAGVTDIKNLKIKIKQSGKEQLEDSDKRVNSPWNIAVDFDVDMSLSVKEITSMLTEYEKDHHTGMNIEAIATEIRAYTNGYPYLVSRICQKIDNNFGEKVDESSNEKLKKDWTVKGVERAIKIMLREEDTTLNDDIFKNLNNSKNLNTLMYNIVALGKQYSYGVGVPEIKLGLTYGLLQRLDDDKIVIGNKFFETLLYKHYASKMEIEGDIKHLTKPSEVISDGKLNMTLLIEKFARHYYETYKGSRKKFLEDDRVYRGASQCRMLFITFLQPLINGAGFYHVESETRDEQRMDVIVDYGSEQFIVELKIWNGGTKHDKALDQVVGYLDRKNKDVGYLLTFDFRERGNVGAPQKKWCEHGGKKILYVIVGIAPPKRKGAPTR